MRAPRPPAANAWKLRRGCGAPNAFDDSRLVAARRVLVDDALVRHFVHERERIVQTRVGGFEVVVLDRRADLLQGRSQAAPLFPVVIPPLDALPVGLLGR